MDSYNKNDYIAYKKRLYYGRKRATNNYIKDIIKKRTKI